MCLHVTRSGAGLESLPCSWLSDPFSPPGSLIVCLFLQIGEKPLGGWGL